MSNLKSFLKVNSKFLLLTSAIVITYFITRLVNLTIIPVFCDEAIYIRWAQVMRADGTLRFLPLSDGKQPLFMWLVIPFLKVLKDPLAAGRMVSVLSGFGTMAGIFVLSHLLFKKLNLSFLASFLYIFSPFALFFDRLALADGLLSFWGVWCLVFGYSLARKVRLDLAMILGIILGLGLITKSPAIFFALLLPATIFLFDFGGNKKVLHLGKLVVLWLVAYVFAFAIYNILRLGPEFQMIVIRNKDYIFSFNEILKHPLNPFWGNFKNVIWWFWILLTPPVFILGLLGILWMLKKNFKEGAVILIWFLFPILAQSAVAKVFTARYILFSTPFFLIFGAFCLSFFWRSDLQRGRTSLASLALLLLVIFVLPIYQSFLLITNPEKAWLPVEERKGYLEMWTAGYGIKEASLYLRKVAEKEKVLVGTEGYFGTLPNGLQIYLEKVPNITVIGVGYPIKVMPEKLTNSLKDNRVFLLVNDTRFEMKNIEKLKLIASYPKAKNLIIGIQENLLFFEVLK